MVQQASDLIQDDPCEVRFGEQRERIDRAVGAEDDGAIGVDLEAGVGLGDVVADDQVVVGFAAETERVQEHAAAKLAVKRVDLMVANDVSAPDAGFEVDTNRAVLLDAAGGVAETPLLTKADLAGVVLDRVAALVDQRLGDVDRRQGPAAP